MIKRYVPKQTEQTTSEIGKFCGFMDIDHSKGILLRGCDGLYYWISHERWQIDKTLKYESIRAFIQFFPHYQFFFADTLAELFRWMGEE